MKRKNVIISFSAIVLLLLTLAVGTFAKYQKDFFSGESIIKSSKFDVYTDINNDMTLNIENAYPGMPEQYFPFVVNKQDTAVPILYTIELMKSGELFTIENSPVQVILQRYDEINNIWIDVQDQVNITVDESAGEIIENNKDYQYRVRVTWPFETLLDDGTVLDDTVLANKTGNFSIKFHTEQVPVANIDHYSKFINVNTYIRYKENNDYFFNPHDIYLLEYLKIDDGRRVIILHDVDVYDKNDNNSLIIIEKITFTETAIDSGQYCVDGYSVNNSFVLNESEFEFGFETGSEFRFSHLPIEFISWLE